MSTSDVAIPSTSLKKLFDASSLNASLVYSIPLAANLRFVCVLAGNTFAIRNSIPPISAVIAPSATGKRNTDDVNQ
ncbi:hypothetical protein ARMSODRAFT_1088201 [Armillaria solidipes]|uniref:Uncharacterized protein n=1 Tax=Armillaria solidipes TaxID=1076256 RepID=A0A2H3AZD3_9AGAR|nr:hypothetical protein ARMSODRAFT_1088201 [Armillaria solidipes]